MGRVHSLCLACGTIRVWGRLSRGERMHALFNGERFRRPIEILRDMYLTPADRRKARGSDSAANRPY